MIGLIETAADIEAALADLCLQDPRLIPIAEIAGPLPLRRRPGGFEGLTAIVTAQQISGAAAESIWTRLKATVDPFTPSAFLATSEEALRAAGLSRPKISNLVAAATAMEAGFDLDRLGSRPAAEAVAAMTTLKGIGPWTAESYLLFCIGHADIFPAGDLALQIAAQEGLDIPARPDDRALRAIAQRWSPWRSVAARLFWAYYRVRRSSARGPTLAAIGSA